MCGAIFSYMRYSLLESDTLCSDVVMDVVSRFQATIIDFSTPEVTQPVYDFHDAMQ